MYPAAELNAAAAQKALLRRRIALRRATIVVTADRVARPLRVADRIVAEWRRLSPLIKLAAVPLGALLGRSLHRKRRLIGQLIRWGPLLAGAWRGFAVARKAAPAQKNSPAQRESPAREAL
ncbi:MAG: hypothetical protein HYV96_01735 [Opitutae bacterium]|nr:hypothetical protein [Opitutae bacterium]